MNITTYENTVKKGTIKAHGRSDGLREMLEQLSEMQKIVTAPMSVDTPEQDGDKAPETAAQIRLSAVQNRRQGRSEML